MKHFLAVLALALLASCAPSRLVSQQPNPDYIGKPFKSVMVVAVASDDLVRRTFEDRLVAMLAKRGVKGIPSCSVVGARRQIEEAELRRALERSGVEGVLMTRVIRV